MLCDINKCKYVIFLESFPGHGLKSCSLCNSIIVTQGISCRFLNEDGSLNTLGKMMLLEDKL